MRIVTASAVVLCLVNSASPVWPADAATPLVVEAWIKEGPKRRFQTRIVDHLDHFDSSSREPLDVYGGWKTNRYDATGFFYPKKIGDRWWLIDPQFEEHAGKVAGQTAAWKDDPYLLGYFSDNELPFPGDLLDRYLRLEPHRRRLDGSHPARAWLVLPELHTRAA